VLRLPWEVLRKRDRHSTSIKFQLGYGLDDRGSRVRFPAGAANFSLHHRVQNNSGAHPASYPLCNRALSLEVKRRDLKITTHLHLVQRSKNEWCYTSTPNAPLWRGAQLKKVQGQSNLYHLPLHKWIQDLNTTSYKW
jgi:hypothetical protein